MAPIDTPTEAQKATAYAEVAKTDAPSAPKATAKAKAGGAPPEAEPREVIDLPHFDDPHEQSLHNSEVAQSRTVDLDALLNTSKEG